jgi:putative ATPase
MFLQDGKPFDYSTVQKNKVMEFENQMNIFEKPKMPGQLGELQGSLSPLAHRMRPRDLTQLIGHKKILSEHSTLARWIASDQVPSLILWGPPGCGKTTLAEIIAKNTQHRSAKLSAVNSGIKDIREVAERCSQKALLFVDEVHRFNRSQQDTLLPYVETGRIVLIGATTENPSFELNAALLSRLKVIRLEPLLENDIAQIVLRCLEQTEPGLKGLLQLEDDVIHWLAQYSDGDARKALTTLEHLALASAKAGFLPTQKLTLSEAKNLLESELTTRTLVYDKNADEHHNVSSAFIKSLRDSDPHAALYYAARMIEGGEDALFIARRMVVFASEDIGNADPRALTVALAVKDAVDFVGMPEARINLAQAVTYLALAPKSNASYVGIESALEKVRETGSLGVPMHLRNAPTSLMKQHGYGKNYKYAHDAVEGRPKQTHLPESLIGERFYHPKNVGLEKTFKEKLDILNPDFEIKS